MPYISQNRRDFFDHRLNLLIESIKTEKWNVGDLNYIISKILWTLFEENPKYKTINDIYGILEGVKLEFGRRKASPYEDHKINNSGDLIIED